MQTRRFASSLLLWTFLVLEAPSSHAQVEHTGTIPAVPGYPAGTTVNYRVAAVKTGDKTAHFWLRITNPNDFEIKIVVCSMLSLHKAGKTVPKFIVEKNGASEWECRRSGDSFGIPPNFHMSCVNLTVPAKATRDAFDRPVEFSESFTTEELGAVYFDVLKDCPLRNCDQVVGPDKFLIPSPPTGHRDWVNIWAGHSPFQRLVAVGSISALWPSGNWVTMGYPDEYPAVLRASVAGVPRGATVQFIFAGTQGGRYEIPDDGFVLQVEEPFFIPDHMEALDSIVITVPEDIRKQLEASVTEGRSMRLDAEVLALPGAAFYSPSEFMYGINMTFVHDTRPPNILLAEITPEGSVLRVRIEADDATSMASGASFVYSAPDGVEHTRAINFDLPSSRGDVMLFADVFDDLPAGVPITYRVDVYDDVGNRASTGPAQVTLEPAFHIVDFRRGTNNTATIIWEGGLAPYTVERKERLADPAWQVVTTVGAKTAQVTLDLPTSFFRVVYGQQTAPPEARIDTPAYTGRRRLETDPGQLPANVVGNMPSFDGDSFFFTLPATEAREVSAQDIADNLLLPVMKALGYTRGVESLRMPGTDGLEHPRASFDGVIRTLNVEFNNNPQAQAPKSSDMMNAFLERQGSPEVDAALLTGEGMTLAQYIADIERLEITYPFQQVDSGIPIEHTGIHAVRWDGQGITRLWGAFFDKYKIENQIRLDAAGIVRFASSNLVQVPGIRNKPFPEKVDAGPALVLLPYGGDQNEVRMRYAYRIIIHAYSELAQDVGPYMLWADADTGDLLKLDPLIHNISASGTIYHRHPDIGTTLVGFDVDPAAAGQYTLQLAGVMNRVDYANDGYNATDVSIADSANGSSATFANFNQSPLNDPATALCGGANRAFVQVNFFGAITQYYRDSVALGIFAPFPTSAWSPRVDEPGFCNANSTMRFGACAAWSNATCPDFSTGTVDPNANWLSAAVDNTVVAHELAHNVTPRFTSARPFDWCGIPPCAIPLGWGRFHDLADFWADHWESCNCTAGWFAKNEGGADNALDCAVFHDELGGLPRFHHVDLPFTNPAAPEDHFPEHRTVFGVGGAGYSDGQIAAAALWKLREGMRSKCRWSGVPQFGVRFARALRNAGFLGADPGASDTGIYRRMHDLGLQLVEQWATSGSPGGPPAFRHNGPHTTSKVTAGLAKAGFFLIPFEQLGGDPLTPINGGDAVIDLDDIDTADDYVINGCPSQEVDFLEAGGPAPLFHVWTGPRYRLDGPGGAATYSNPAPCNARFRVEVSTDPGFAPASTVNSPWITVPTDPTVAGATVGYGTWTPSAAEWTTLQSGSGNCPSGSFSMSCIYYRARTQDGSGGNERLSTSPGNGLWTVPPPYAVVTANGQSDY